jgi:hypothetical protein
MDPEKLKAVRKWPPPKVSFLGVCTYYQTFTAGYVDIAKPLTQLTEVEFSMVSRGRNLLLLEGVTVWYPS